MTMNQTGAVLLFQVSPSPCLQHTVLPQSPVSPLCAHSPLSLQLVKTHDLSPGHNYIIGSHPHGILCVGAFCNFITGSTGFSELFPGIRPFLTTLAGNFRLPLFREYLMSGGEWCDVGVGVRCLHPCFQP